MKLQTKAKDNFKSCRILGSQTRYWEYHGDKKPTIVAIHGFRGTHHGLEFIVRELPQYRIIIPDLPGFGDSTPMKKTIHSAENYAQFARQFIATLKLPTPPILLGHSFGSVIAANVASQWPETISQLILINPITRHGSTWQSHSGLQTTRLFYGAGQKLPPRFGRRLLASRRITKIMNLVLAQTKDPALKRRVHDQHLAYFAKFHNREILHQTFVSSINDTVAEHAPGIEAKTLLIGGAKDAIVPLKSQRQLQKLFPQACLKIIDNTGHLIHYEKPETAARLISDFLAE